MVNVEVNNLVEVEQSLSPKLFIGLLNQVVPELVIDELEGPFNDCTQNQIRSFTVNLVLLGFTQGSQERFHHTNSISMGSKLDQPVNTYISEVNQHLSWHQLDELPHEMVAVVVLNQQLEVRYQELSYFLKLIRTGQQRDKKLEDEGTLLLADQMRDFGLDLIDDGKPLRAVTRPEQALKHVVPIVIENDFLCIWQYLFEYL